MAASKTAGSGIFSTQQAARGHILAGHGISKEVVDLRSDIVDEFSSTAGIAVEEWTDLATADVDAFLLAKDTLTATAVTYDVDDLDGVVGADEMPAPRNITITTTGTDADFAPTKVFVVNGVDVNGDVISENFSITAAASPGTFAGAKAFVKVTSIVVPVLGTHTDATFSVGFGAIIGLSKKLMSRAGLATAIMEIEAGSKVTTGTIVAATTGLPNGTYAPANAPNAGRDYALYYEFDATP